MKKENNQHLTEVFIFDIVSEKLIKTGINGHLTMAQFDSSGNNLVLSLNDRTVSIASLNDFKPGKTIVSGWVHSCSPKTPFAVVFVPPDRNMSTEEFMPGINGSLMLTQQKAELETFTLRISRKLKAANNNLGKTID